MTTPTPLVVKSQAPRWGKPCAKHPELEGARNARNHRCLGCERERDQRRYRKANPASKARATPRGAPPWPKTDAGRAYRKRWLATPAGLAYAERRRLEKLDRERRGRAKSRKFEAEQSMDRALRDVFKPMRPKRSRW